jgi:hypothetical protein
MALFKRGLMTAIALLVAGCGEDPSIPYVEIVGGGFVFNYRYSEAYYGFTVRPKRKLAEGTVLEASFAIPGGLPDEVVKETVRGGRLQYTFRTGSIKGIVKDHPYRAVLRVLEKEGGPELARYEREFKSTVDQSGLPDKPAVTGPGYQPAGQ